MRWVLVVLAVCGIIVSSLALHVHYSDAAEICNINAHWDCGTVNHSEFAEIHRVPVALIGILGYILLGLAALLRQRALLALLALAACAFSLHLTLIEKNVLQIWCLYCVISQTIIALILLISIVWLFAGYRRRATA